MKQIRLKDFNTYTRAATINKPTNFANIIYNRIRQLYEGFDTKGKEIRLIGVKVSNLLPAGFNDSFFKEDVDEKNEKIHKAIDKIKEKFGDIAIHRAGSKI